MNPLRTLVDLFMHPTRRMQLDIEADIRVCLAGNVRMTGYQIGRCIGLGPHAIYPALERMTAKGEIASMWIEGDYPRSRVYALIT